MSLTIILALKILPINSAYIDFCTIFQCDKNMLFIQLRDLANRTVHISCLWIVSAEDYLSTNFQSKKLWHWSIILLKVIMNIGLITKLLFFDGIQFLVVDLFCHIVKGCQCHRVIVAISVFFNMLIKQSQILICYLSVAHLVQDVKESLITLSIHLLEFNLWQVHPLQYKRLVKERKPSTIEIM